MNKVLIIVFFLALSFPSFGIEEEKIDRAVENLNQLVSQNISNAKRGLEDQNNYVFFYEDPVNPEYIKEYKIPENYRFIESKVIKSLNDQLRQYAAGDVKKALYFGIDGSNIKVLHQLISPSKEELAEKRNKEELTKKIAEVKERIKSNTIQIFERSKAPEYGALVTISPVDFYLITHALENGELTSDEKDDDIRRWYYSYGALGSFWDDETISLLRGTVKEEGLLQTFNEDANAAFTKYVGIWQEALMEDMLAKQNSADDFTGFAASYYERYFSEDLSEEDNEYLSKLCGVFNNMGISLATSYESEIREEDLNRIGQALVRGKFNGTRPKTFQELYEEYNSHYDAYLKSVEKLEVEVTAEKIVATISTFNEEELQSLPIHARLQALKYVNTVELEGGLFFKNSEDYVLGLLSQTPSGDVAKLLESLKTEKVNKKGIEVSLIYALMHSYDDGLIAANNYSSLLNVFKELILSSPEALSSHLTFEDNSLDNRIYYWRSVGLLQTYCNTHNEGDFRYDFEQLANGKVKVEKSYLSIKKPTQIVMPGPRIIEGFECGWQDHPSIELDPFDLVIFIDVSNSSLVASGDHDIADYAVPAIFLEYIADKDFDQKVLEGIVISADLITLVASGGGLTAALKTGRWALAAWEAAEIAGALGNLTLMSHPDPELTEVLQAYDAVMIAVGIKNLVRGSAFSISTIKKASPSPGSFADEALRTRFLTAYKKALGKLDQLGGSSEKIKGLAKYFGAGSSISRWVDDLPPKLSHLTSKPDILSKLDEIVGSGRGVDHTKLKQALDGDLGDVLTKAGDKDLTDILNRFSENHFTGSHLDEITSRLGKYPVVKLELVNNPTQFKFFDEVLRNPENYRELAQLGEIPTSSPLYKWSLGKFRKQILDNAEKLENTVSSNIRNYVDVPDGYKIATQVHLGDGVKRTIPDDFIYDPIPEIDPITSVEYHRAIIHDSKLHADVPWTDNQYNLIIKKFEDGASYVDLNLRSPIDGLEQGDIIRIYKSDIHKSIGTPDKTGSYLSTSKVF